jgi:hypothetical protein
MQRVGVGGSGAIDIHLGDQAFALFIRFPDAATTTAIDGTPSAPLWKLSVTLAATPGDSINPFSAIVVQMVAALGTDEQALLDLLDVFGY